MNSLKMKSTEQKEGDQHLQRDTKSDASLNVEAVSQNWIPISRILRFVDRKSHLRGRWNEVHIIHDGCVGIS